LLRPTYTLGPVGYTDTENIESKDTKTAGKAALGDILGIFAPFFKFTSHGMLSLLFNQDECKVLFQLKDTSGHYPSSLCN